MNTFSYDDIFSKYTTAEGIPFNLLARSINLPEDKTLELYNKIFVDKDIAWTILSYMIYGTIELWWLLCAANRNDIFYAKAESEVFYIKPEYVDSVISSIKSHLN